MRPRLERDSNGRMVLRKDRRRNGPAKGRIVAAGLAIAFVAIAATGIQAVIAAGGQVQHNYQQNLGEDGYYEEYNQNPYDDTDFPGLDTQNRTGVD